MNICEILGLSCNDMSMEVWCIESQYVANLIDIMQLSNFPFATRVNLYCWDELPLQ